jgi:tetratricopeptide (TPR) repeat protein
MISLPARLCRLLTLLLLMVASGLPLITRAAPPDAVDHLISELPDPNSWTRSPLETALKDPDPMFSDPAFRRLVASLQGRNPQAALENLRALAATYPAKTGVQFLRGVFALRLKLYLEAEASFQAIIARKTDAPLGWYGLACVQIAVRRPPDALASLRRAVKLQPKFTGAWLLLAIYQTRQGDPGQGITAAQRVTQIAPDLPVGWAVLGYCESSARKYDDAIPCYQRAIRSAHRYAFAYEGLGVCYARTNRPAAALQPLQTALSLAPNDYLAATELGSCCLRAGQPDAGVKACRQAVAVRPDFSQGWNMLGQCYQQQKKMRDAARAFQRAVQTDPHNADAQAHLAALTPPAGR